MGEAADVVVAFNEQVPYSRIDVGALREGTVIFLENKWANDEDESIRQNYVEAVADFNTFNVQAYIESLDAQKLPIALSLELTRRMQMAGWLYWRVYETRFQKVDFKQRFGVEFNRAYGYLTKLLSIMGFLDECDDEIVLTDRGAYWLHVLQDLFSLSYVDKLWGTSQQDPWPSRVIL